jgi:hypothetical protein
MNKDYLVHEIIDGDDYYTKLMTLKEAKKYVDKIIKGKGIEELEYFNGNHLYSKMGRQCLLRIVKK